MIRHAYSVGKTEAVPRLDLLCDCPECKGHAEKVGEVREKTLVIRARRHGRDHVFKIPVDELLHIVLKSC